MKKIRAFTFLEMIINLTLMSIIVSMVYVVYAYFSKNIYDYSSASSENFVVQSFYSQFKEDIFYSDKIISENGKDIAVVFYNNEIVHYSIHNNFFIRKTNLSKDSIEIKSVQLDFLKKKDSFRVDHLIKGITLNAFLFKKEIPLVVYKSYYSNYMITEE